MSRLVLTIIGDDRAGLVASLADIVSAHGGNWEHSQMTELAGQFAGVVVVSVPAGRADELMAALRELDGLMDVAAHPGSDAPQDDSPRQLRIDLLGTDRPGIVREVSGVLHRHELSIEEMTTGSRDAPMAGGQLFEAHIVVRVGAEADPSALRADLEQLAAELMVDLTVDEE